MAAMTLADFKTAIGVVGASEITNKPMFGLNDIVFCINDKPGANANPTKITTPKYTVKRIILLAADSAGVTKPVDQRLAFATPSDQTVLDTGVNGWLHSQSALLATEGTTTDSVPWGYDIQNNDTNELLRDIHQCKLNTLANWETWMAASVAGWYS